ncbi:MAG: hypothetical protein WBC91_21805, partial [Phototrophicaceae bacterium]
MKTKTLTLAVSAMILGTILVMGIAVGVILILGNPDNTSSINASAQSITNTNTSSDYVYLYDSFEHKLIQVMLADASEQLFDLGIPNDRSVYVNNIVISHDGRLGAFCAMDRTENDLVNYRLVVRDIMNEQNILNLALGQIPGCEIGQFNTSNSQIALGIIYNSIIEGANNFPEQPNWALRTFDIATGTIMNELNADMAQAPDFESMTERFWFSADISAMTRAVSFTDDEILFVAYPFVGRDGPPEVPAHRWNLRTGEVAFLEGLTHYGADVLVATGEIVYPYLDENYPAARLMGPAPEANSIRINDNGTIYTIYRNTEEVISRVTFINGGRQIAAVLTRGFDENNPQEGGTSRYEIINRDGSIGQSSTGFISFNPPFGTDDGMLMLNIDQGGAEGNAAQLVRYSNGASSIIWSTDLSPQAWLSLAWAAPMPV